MFNIAHSPENEGVAMNFTSSLSWGDVRLCVRNFICWQLAVHSKKLFNALDIMDAIGNDYAFLPGLNYCCGDSFMFLGDIDKGERQAKLLITTIADFQPAAVVLGYRTCHCHFDKSIAPALDIPFQVMS